MASPCPRCGATKTRSARHGLIYNTLWDMGYHLRRCSFCGRRRLFKRAYRNWPHPDDMTHEQLQEYYERKLAEASRSASAEPAILRPPLVPRFSRASVGRETLGAPASVSVAEGYGETAHHGSCPECGSTIYRRSRRRFFERLLKRPKMARCLRCGHRFPHPDHLHLRPLTIQPHAVGSARS